MCNELHERVEIHKITNREVVLSRQGTHCVEKQDCMGRGLAVTHLHLLESGKALQRGSWVWEAHVERKTALIWESLSTVVDMVS